jgi:hypothetical protein
LLPLESDCLSQAVEEVVLPASCAGKAARMATLLAARPLPSSSVFFCSFRRFFPFPAAFVTTLKPKFLSLSSSSIEEKIQSLQRNLKRVSKGMRQFLKNIDKV